MSSGDHAHSSFLVTEKIKELLVDRLYSNWSKIGSALLLPISSGLWQYTDILKNSIENPASRIDVIVSSDIQM